jgi:hypothetical protein
MDKKYYVQMLDTYMSGWGKATGKKNYYVIECDNLEQAKTIERNAGLRPEMEDIAILTKVSVTNSKRVIVSIEGYNDLGDIWKK